MNTPPDANTPATAKSHRRNFLRSVCAGGATAALASSLPRESTAQTPILTKDTTPQPLALDTDTAKLPGEQRLSVDALNEWESWGYGMFVHFGMSTFLGEELPNPARDQYQSEDYNPSKLDVAQWVSVARDAGMKYMILTAKHVAGHCLWPSKQTDFTVANSPNKTDVVGEFTEQCREKGIKVGIYYCSMDNYHTFGSQMPSTKLPNGKRVPWYGGGKIPQEGEVLPYTTSLYQNFMTAQIDELITGYGQIDQLFIDIPSILGTGYRDWIYERIARVSPGTFIEMNNGLGFNGKDYLPEESFPQDLIPYERGIRSDTTTKWWTVDGKEYYMPGEVLDLIGDNWFWVEGDRLKPAQDIGELYHETRQRGLNYNLNVPPDRTGQIPKESVDRLMEINELIKRDG